jgi:UDP-N-acetylglucosamine 1-carboxyvinyltransferase
MADKLIIEGSNKLEGVVDVRGSKNAATPIIAATLLTSSPCVLENVPCIEDVKKMLEVVQKLGAKVEYLEKRKIRITAKDVSPERLDFDLVNKMRSSILLIGPLLARFGHVRISQPGGCVIGARSIDTHLNAFTKMGVTVEGFELKKNGERRSNVYHFNTEKKLRGRDIVLDELSVTATENIMMAACLANGKTRIKIAATEPHVQDLALFLKKMGADIKGDGTNTIEIKGKESLGGAEHFICYDYIEAGTFILLSLAVDGRVCIKNTPVEHLDLLLSQLNNFGAKLKIGKNEVSVLGGKNIVMRKVQTMPYPGIPTDLQAPLGALSTQTKGLTLIHDPLYEGRLKYLEELNKMGAEIVNCDPHRAIINGPTKLHGIKLDPLDLRAGAALIIAGLVAEGTTVIRDVSQADRGYEEIDKRLVAIGAKIKRVKNGE